MSRRNNTVKERIQETNYQNSSHRDLPSLLSSENELHLIFFSLLSHRLFYSVKYQGIFAFGLNMTVLIMYLKFRSMGSPTALLLANLTVSDLGLIIFNYPFAASSSFANRYEQT